MPLSQTFRNLPDNSRFYILAGTFLLSVGLACWLRAAVPGGVLYGIRLQQVYGVLSLVFLYTALIISPLQKVVGDRAWTAHVVFARRAIGVSAAYFALLHAGVALMGQIGGFSGLTLLPNRFVWSLIFGVVALIVLLIMAATSFNKVIKFMTFPRWKWLHRLVYTAGILVLLHVWMIGTHAAYGFIQLVVVALLALFFGLESWRSGHSLAKRFGGVFWYWFLALCLFWAIMLFALPRLVTNYHNEHKASHSEHAEGNL